MTCGSSWRHSTIRPWAVARRGVASSGASRNGYSPVLYGGHTRYISKAGPQELHEQVHGPMRNPDVFFRAGWLAVMAAGLALSVCGCGSADQPSAATSSANAKASKQHKPVPTSKPGEEALSDMVAAVSSSKAGPPVELKFSLPTRPEVGQVMDVDVAIVPRAPVPDSVSVSFQVVDGIDIVEGAQLGSVGSLVDGTPVRHVVKILPKRDGIFALTAVVSFGASNQDTSRTFSIPVIAGAGLPEQVAKGP